MPIDESKKPLEFWKAVSIMRIDLAGGIRRNLLRPEDLAHMLKNCEQCFALRECAAWQDGHRAKDTSFVPDFCPNHKALAWLAAKSPAADITHPGFRHSARIYG